MKLFQTIQNKFAILGISSHQSTQEQPFNQRIILVYLIYGCSCILSNVYLFRKAQTVEEYTNCIYIATATTMLTLFFSIVVYKMPKLFKYIENVENIVERGEKLQIFKLNLY